ncbi:MAG: hypothetical protein ACPLZE_02665 [Candidatus Bipolaricaulaceae bacterium]
MRWAFAVLWAGVAWAAPASLAWKANLSLTFPTATFAFSSELELAWAMPLWAWKLGVSVEDGVWKRFLLSGSGKAGYLELFPGVEFDPQTPRFLAASVTGRVPWGGGSLVGVARLEEDGFGWGISYMGSRNEPIQRLRLRFNLKRYADEVLEKSFAPSFSFLEAWLRIPLDCCLRDLSLRFSLAKGGFERLSLSLRFPEELLCGLSFWANFIVDAEGKEALILPSLAYTPPAGVVLFLGVDWDRTTYSFRGLKIYAFGFEGALGALHFRTFTSLAENEINFVKDPFWEVVTLKLEIPSCVGEKASAQTDLYFGDTGLFGLGEIAVLGNFPLAQGLRISLKLNVSLVEEKSTVGLGWEVVF